ncbi:MAG: DNA primase [Treponema sp.]|jgi:DNA primase|nr:DNA primase [Treponema sp.]
MARISEASIQQVFDRIDAVAVVEDYLRLEKKSGQYWGRCPFHGGGQEKTPSFKVDPDKKLFYCFGCQKGGSILNFVMEMDKLSYPEAIEAMAKRFSVPLVYEQGAAPENGEREARREEALADLYRRVTVSFHHILMKTPGGEGAKRYILNRGISVPVIEQFRLGFAPPDRYWLYGFLSGKGGFSGDFLASSGLFSPRYPQAAFFSNRLMFPIADRGGRIIAFGGRILEGEGPKYINSQESDLFKKGRTLFALDLALPEIRNTKEVYLAEGYMDVIALHQAGVTNAVAPLGTAFTEDQAKLLRRWADKVNLMLDSDDAGQNAAIKAILSCRKSGLDCTVVSFQDFFKDEAEIPKDPAEILHKFGAETLKKSARCCILDLNYIISRGMALREEKSQAVAFLFPYLDALDSEVTRDVSIGIIADAFGVERRAVLDDYRALSRTSPGVPKEAEAGPEKPPFHPGDEIYLLAAVFVNPGFFKALRSGLALEDLEDRHARELYIFLEEWYRRSGGEVQAGTAGELLEAVPNGDVRNFIMRQGALGAFAHPEKLLTDGMKRVRSKVLERKRRAIIRELRDPSLEAVMQGDLLAEKIHIDTELTKLKEGPALVVPAAPGRIHEETRE